MKIFEIEKRFFAKVKKIPNHCWEWQAAKDLKGYGWFRFKGKTCLSHRVSWEIHRGPIPDGMCVLHKCDNPPCVNPDHLFLGTNRDNSLDMMDKERRQYKLTRKEVFNIRHHYSSGKFSQLELANKYRVSEVIIRQVVTGKIWKFAGGELSVKNGEKLSSEQVVEIRKLYSSGRITQTELGKKYGVHHSQISNIVRGKQRKGVDCSLCSNNNYKHKLSSAQVKEIRKRYAEGGISQRELGKKYGVDHSQIGNIVRFKQRNI